MLIVKLAEGGQFEPGKTAAVPPEPVDVLNKVTPRFGSELMAYAWCMSEPLSGFDGRTAMQPVRESEAQQVLDYIDAVDAGVFA